MGNRKEDHLHIVGDNVDNLSEQRLWSTLDGLNNKLSVIESQLTEVVRLQEKVSNQGDIIKKHDERLNHHERRIHQSELWQANYGDRSSVERLITHIQEEIHTINSDIVVLRAASNVDKGQKQISSSVFKWVSGILAAFIVYLITNPESIGG